MIPLAFFTKENHRSPHKGSAEAKKAEFQNPLSLKKLSYLSASHFRVRMHYNTGAAQFFSICSAIHLCFPPPASPPSSWFCKHVLYQALYTVKKPESFGIEENENIQLGYETVHRFLFSSPSSPHLNYHHNPRVCRNVPYCSNLLFGTSIFALISGSGRSAHFAHLHSDQRVAQIRAKLPFPYLPKMCIFFLLFFGPCPEFLF